MIFRRENPEQTPSHPGALSMFYKLFCKTTSFYCSNAKHEVLPLTPPVHFKRSDTHGPGTQRRTFNVYSRWVSTQSYKLLLIVLKNLSFGKKLVDIFVATTTTASTIIKATNNGLVFFGMVRNLIQKAHISWSPGLSGLHRGPARRRNPTRTQCVPALRFFSCRVKERHLPCHSMWKWHWTGQRSTSLPEKTWSDFKQQKSHDLCVNSKYNNEPEIWEGNSPGLEGACGRGELYKLFRDDNERLLSTVARWTQDGKIARHLAISDRPNFPSPFRSNILSCTEEAERRHVYTVNIPRTEWMKSNSMFQLPNNKTI